MVAAAGLIAGGAAEATKHLESYQADVKNAKAKWDNAIAKLKGAEDEVTNARDKVDSVCSTEDCDCSLDKCEGVNDCGGAGKCGSCSKCDWTCGYSCGWTAVKCIANKRFCEASYGGCQTKYGPCIAAVTTCEKLRLTCIDDAAKATAKCSADLAECSGCHSGNAACLTLKEPPKLVLLGALEAVEAAGKVVDESKVLLDLAVGALELAKKAVKAGADAADWLATKGAEAFVLHEASFQLELGSMTKMLSMHLDVTVIGQRHVKDMAIDFDDLAAAAKGLVKQLMPTLPGI